MKAGESLGPYRILDKLGEGGMGEVYRARDTKLGRHVAIKVLPRDFARDSERVQRFEREARLLAAVNHPAIATIHGVEDADGTPALVMELVEGPTLAEKLAKGRLPVAEALSIARQIAEALEAAHARGVVHRDLKPANIKLRPDGPVKVLDFGLAKAFADRSDGALSQMSTMMATDLQPGLIMGTPAYMSPEQARGEPVDQRTDIWAFGCVLYEMLTARLAFAGRTLSDIIAAILERDPDWYALPGSVPANIRRLLRDCLEKDPAQRPPAMAQVRTEINVALTPRSRRPLRLLAIGTAAAAVLLVAAGGILVWQRSSRPTVANRSEWVQLTNLPDSVSQPALSPDGRMLAFVRGSGTFQTEGQVYIKLLPDGEPRQITRDDSRKMSPVFSPDGSQVAYTTISSEFGWDTWVAPVLGGEPSRWLPNASGLVWIDRERLLFSEIKTGVHMGIVTAGQSRADTRDVYVPAHERGMAHRSYPSPDGTTALVSEMDGSGTWTPCRLVPLDGSSVGRQVGPPGGCTFGAWSRDGRWIYLSSNAGGAFHLWRQRVPDGEPAQITSGPTEEEGIAVAPDGRSIVTAVGLTQRPIVLRNGPREQEISLEGYAFNPKFTPDGTKLLYQVLKSPGALDAASDLWIADVESGRRELLFPAIPSAGVSNSVGGGSYDVSPDGRRVVLTSNDSEGRPRVWVLPLDRSSPPRQVPGIEGHQPVFGPPGEIIFRSDEENAFLYRVREDGTERRRLLDELAMISGLSPDRQLLIAWTFRLRSGTSAYPVNGGPPVPIWGRDARLRWSSDGRSVFLSLSSTANTLYGGGRTYVIPLPSGRLLPEIPPGGFRTEPEIAKLPGVRLIDAADVAPGPVADIFAFSRITTQRNLYRIPLP
jgi:serine/threonine protein kinase